MQLHDIAEQIDASNAMLKGSRFDDVNLAGAQFENVSLAGAKFNDVDMSDVVITAARIDRMTIRGVSVEDLFAAYYAQKKE